MALIGIASNKDVPTLEIDLVSERIKIKWTRRRIKRDKCLVYNKFPIKTGCEHERETGPVGEVP